MYKVAVMQIPKREPSPVEQNEVPNEDNLLLGSVVLQAPRLAWRGS